MSGDASRYEAYEAKVLDCGAMSTRFTSPGAPFLKQNFLLP